MIVAIDGPAGSGKSTTAKQTAEHLNFVHIDTGAMYRAVTYYFQTENITLNDSVLIENALQNIHISFKNGMVYLNGSNVNTEIRSNTVSQFVSAVSALSNVRDHLVTLQRKMSENLNVVLEGRDIGTRVFPNAHVKIFLNASLEVRGLRRYHELKSKNNDISVQQVINELQKRDEVDSNRKHSPLQKAEDAIEIDTSNLSINEQVNTIVKIINKHRSETH
jgi:cytidylate kinase